MDNWLAKLPNLSSGIKHIVTSVGPYLIAQSTLVSEAFSPHKLRMASTDIASDFLKAEAQSIASMRDTLRSQYTSASLEDRIRIRRDIDELERDMRQLQTAVLALQYLPQHINACDKYSKESQSSNNDNSIISDHWLDKFSQLARSKNEDWRQNLLARALAAEAAEPSSVSVRALWLIGVLEEDKFRAFSALLDIASIINEIYVVPGHWNLMRTIPSCKLGEDVLIGSLIYALSDTGLLADSGSQIQIPAGEKLVLGYNQLDFTIDCEVDINITGQFLSPIGNSIAAFYQRCENPFGQALLKNWLEYWLPNEYDKKYTITPFDS